MKFLYFTVVIAVLSLSSIKCAEANDWNWDCNAQQLLAESIMELRQYDEPKNELINRFEETFFKVMVIGAFQTPLADTKEDKDTAVEAYGNNWYNACLKMNERQY